MTEKRYFELTEQIYIDFYLKAMSLFDRGDALQSKSSVPGQDPNGPDAQQEVEPDKWQVLS